MSTKTCLLNQAELIIRMVEASSSVERPPHESAVELVAGLEHDTREALLAMSRAAIEYFVEITGGKATYSQERIQ